MTQIIAGTEMTVGGNAFTVSEVVSVDITNSGTVFIMVDDGERQRWEIALEGGKFDGRRSGGPTYMPVTIDGLTTTT